MNQGNRAAKAGAYYTISNLLVKSLAFLSTPIFTRLLSKNEVGEFANIASWIAILTPILTLNLSSSIVIAKQDIEEFDDYILSVSLCGTVFTGIIYLLALINIDLVAKWLGVPTYAIHIMLIYMMISPVMDIMQAKLRAEFNFWPIVLMSIVMAVISLGSSVAFVLFMNDGTLARTIGMYVMPIAIDICIYGYVILKGNRVRWKYCKYALVIALPLVINSFAGSIMNSSDRVMITKLCGYEETAMYSVAYSMAAMLNILRNSMGNAWEPWLFSAIRENSRQDIYEKSKYYVLFFGYVCILMILFAPEGLLLMGGEAYVAASKVIPPVVVGYYMCMLYNLYGGVEIYYKKQNWFVVVAIVTAGLNVWLNYIFIPVYGYLAAAYTTLFCMGLQFLMHFLRVRLLKKHMFYDTKFVFFTAFIMCCIAVFANYIYDSIIVRYVFIGLLGLLSVIITVKFRLYDVVRRILR